MSRRADMPLLPPHHIISISVFFLVNAVQLSLLHMSHSHASVLVYINTDQLFLVPSKMPDRMFRLIT